MTRSTHQFIACNKTKKHNLQLITPCKKIQNTSTSLCRSHQKRAWMFLNNLDPNKCHSTKFLKIDFHPIMVDYVGKMVQNSQSLYSFTFKAPIDIHEYIYSHSTKIFSLFTFAGVFLTHDYICSHLRDVLIQIQHVICIHIHDRNIHSGFSAHHLCASLGPSSRSTISECNMADGGWRKTYDPKHKCYLG